MPVKVLVLIFVSVVTGFGIWGNLLLEQKFDITWFLPPDTYLAKFFVKNKIYFPFGGDRVTLYFHDVDIQSQLNDIRSLVVDIQNQTDIVDEVDDWTLLFVNYANKYLLTKGQGKLPNLETNQTHFNSMLTQFMFSPRGGKYRARFKFKEPLKCGEPTAGVALSSIMFTHR